MGFDITLHPISENELKRFVYDVANNPEIARERVPEITPDLEKQTFLLENVYSEFVEFKSMRDSGKNIYMGASYTYAAAIIAGFLHPFFYSYGACVAIMVSEFEDSPWTRITHGLAEMEPNVFTNCYDSRDGWFGGNAEGWGYVKHEELQNLQTLIDSPEQEEALEYWWQDGKNVVLEVMEYCLKHKIGFLEATDVVIPFTGSVLSDTENLTI